MDGEDFYSVEQAADTLELTPGRVRQMLRAGDLEGIPHRANARARLASQIVKAQMNLLFLSGVEVPDPEQIVMDALESMNVPMPELSDLLSQPMDFPSAREIPDPTPKPPKEYVIPQHKPTRDRTSVPPDAGADEDDVDFRHFDPAIDY